MKRLKTSVSTFFVFLGLAASLQVVSGRFNAAFADLGTADTSTNQEFDAWCAKPKNDCKVVFADGLMKVGDSAGIRPSQVVGLRTDYEKRGFWDRTPGNYYYPVYYVDYRKSDGSVGYGKFLFINEGAAQRFWDALQSFSRKTDPLAGLKKQQNESLEAGSANRFNSMLQETDRNLGEMNRRQQEALVESQRSYERQQLIDAINKPVECSSTSMVSGSMIYTDTECD